MANNTVPLVRFLRSHPALATIPIVLAEGTPAGQAWASPASAEAQTGLNTELAKAFNELVAGGDTNLHYMKTADLFSASVALDGSGTAEGCHPVDAGHHDVAAAWVSVLKPLLGGGSAKGSASD